MSSLETPILGYGIVDSTGNLLLYAPTVFPLTDTIQYDNPFNYDNGSFTVFRDMEIVDELRDTYSYEFDDHNWKVVPISGISEDALVRSLQ